jgi:hypothetical protein
MNGFQIGSKRLKVQHKRTGDDLPLQGSPPMHHQLLHHQLQEGFGPSPLILSPNPNPNMGGYASNLMFNPEAYLPSQSYLSPQPRLVMPASIASQPQYGFRIGPSSGQASYSGNPFPSRYRGSGIGSPDSTGMSYHNGFSE